jgi:protein kinase-like protein
MSEDWQDTVTAADLSLEVSRRSSVSRAKPVLPGYELHEVLGAGAFGQVYRAIQHSTGQVVAVKVLFSVTDGFREEVKKLSQVSDHPNIVTLVDADLDADPPYFVTPYLSGSLRQRVPTQPDEVDLKRVAKWFEEVAGALQFVHGRGILHCDLKPANILLGEDDQPRLVDFGQSVALEGREMRLGSFWFMPWEQAQMPGEQSVVPQVGWDLYALGATVYTLLTGQLPRATELARESLSELQTGYDKVEKYRELIRTSNLKPVRELNPKVDRELAAIVEACLRAEDRPRYESASEVVADLRRRRETFPVRAWPGSRWYVLERFYARHRLSVTVAGLALSLLVVGFVWASHRIYQANQARQAVIVSQYERGLSLLDRGRASGLVWLAEAARQSPSSAYQETLQGMLSTQLRIADPRLYRLHLSTAPSPSGTWGISKDPKDPGQRVLVDLTDGSMSALPAEIKTLNLNQKDTVRYRLDGVVLDPKSGSGGPAVWRLPPFDSVSPVNKDASLALLVRPDLVLQVKRTSKGFRVYDSSDKLRFAVEGSSFSPSAPTFSLQGDLAVGWEDGRVELYPRQEEWTPRTLARSYTELLCFSPKGDRLAGHDGDSKVTVWDLEGKILAEFEVGATANEMAFDESGDLLVCVTRDALVHGYRIGRQSPAWSPAEMETAALWVFVQPEGQIVTMSDEMIVWQQPEPQDESPQSLETLTERVGLWTGWIYDEDARVRTLTREEYLRLTDQE